MASNSSSLPVNVTNALWSQALASIPDDLKLANNTCLANVKHLELLSDVLKVAKEKRDQCLGRQWRVKRSNGKPDLVLRDVFEKLIRWVNVFKEVGDVGIQFNPGAASLPWAGIRFLLKAMMNEVELFGRMIETLEAVAYIIVHCTHLEHLYLQLGSSLSIRSELESATTKLYAEILILLGQTIKYFRENTAVRIAKGLFSQVLDTHKLRVLQQQVLQLANTAQAEIQIGVSEEMRKIQDSLRDINSPMTRLVNQATVFEKNLEEKRFQRLRDWVSTTPYTQYHRLHSNKRISGTGQWLTSHQTYLEWKGSSASELLLLYGIRGCGKTVLSSKVIDSYLRERNGNTAAAPIAYHYCADYQYEADRGEPNVILRSILRQLAITEDHHSVRDQLALEFERREAKAKSDGFDIQKLSNGDCVRLLLEVIGDNPAVIVVDAVDEVTERQRSELLEVLRKLSSESTGVVKIFLTSRDSTQILNSLSDVPKIRVNSTLAEEDMKRFVDSELKKATYEQGVLLLGTVSADLLTTLSQSLTKGAGEMFLWAEIQIDMLCKMKNEQDIRDSMHRLPPAELDRLYDDVLGRILESGPHASTIATRAFCLLLSLRELLQPSAFISAVCICTSEEALDLEHLLYICCNLILFDTHLNVVRFIHQSVPDFLRTKQDFDIATHLVATTCLHACIQGPTADEHSSKNNFYQYGATYWPVHYASTQEPDSDPELSELMKRFVFKGHRPSRNFVMWFRDVAILSKELADDSPIKIPLMVIQNKKSSPLFLACVFGLDELLDTFFESPDFNSNERNGEDTTAVYIASAFGHGPAVKFLLERGADPNIQCGKFGSCLYAACYKGHVNVVSLLLRHGVSTTTGQPFESALEAAYRGNHEDIANLITERSSNELSENALDAALKGASRVGFLQVVEQLRQARGHLITSLPDVLDILPPDGVATASLHGHGSMIVSLLNRGLSIEREGEFGLPLRCASVMGHQTAVQTLLAHGADVNAMGTYGDALQAACMKGFTPIVQILLNTGAHVNQESGIYGTALQAAAFHGHVSIVLLLLEAGANIEAKGICKDAFHAAAEGGRQEVVQLFLEKGHKVYTTISPPSPLCASPPARPQDEERIHLRSIRTHKQHRSPGYLDFGEMAFSNSPSEKVRLNGKQYVIGQDEEKQIADYALQAASCAGDEEVIKVLLDEARLIVVRSNMNVEMGGANLAMVHGEITAAFQDAVKNGHLHIVQRLLNRFRDVIKSNISNSIGPALKDAACLEDLEVFHLLLPFVSDYTTYGRFWENLLSLDAPFNPEAVRQGFDFANSNPNLGNRHELRDLAIIRAASLTDTTLLKSLLSSGITFENHVLRRAWSASLASGNARSAAILLKLEQFQDPPLEDITSSIDECLEKGYEDLIHLLLHYPRWKYGLKLKPSWILVSARKGLTNLLAGFIQRGRDMPWYKGILDLSLKVACFYGRPDVVNLLLSEGANIESHINVQALNDGRVEQRDNTEDEITKNAWLGPYTALSAALISFQRLKNDDCLQSPEFEAGSVIQQSKSSLHLPIPNSQDREQVVKLLLEKGADSNIADGPYPLLIAIELCSKNVVQALLHAGADANLRTTSQTPLELACARLTSGGPIVSQLLYAGASIPCSDRGKINPLLNAALDAFVQLFGNLRPESTFLSDLVYRLFSDGPGRVIEVILHKLPYEKATDKRYGLVLQMAAATGTLSFVQLLLSHKIDVEVVDYYYGTALQAASRFGRVEIVKYLLEAGACVNTLGGEFETPLRAAVIEGNIDVVEHLLRHGAIAELRMNSSSPTAFHIAVEKRMSDIARMLLATGSGAEDDSESLQRLFDKEDLPEDILHMACRNDDPLVVESLILVGRKSRRWQSSTMGSEHTIDEVVLRALRVACESGHQDVVQVLLSSGAVTENHSQHLESLIETASRNDFPIIVQQLLNSKVEIVRNTRQPAAGCVSNVPKDHATVVSSSQSFKETEERNHAAVKAADQASYSYASKSFEALLPQLPITPKTLLQACACSSEYSIETLIDHGVDPNEDFRGIRPLDISVDLSVLSVVNLLIARGVDVHYRGTYGSPLMAALESCMGRTSRATRISENLSCPHWDLFQPDQHETSSLINESFLKAPAPREREELMIALLDSGANPKDECRIFGTALHMASFMGFSGVVKHLLAGGADPKAHRGCFDIPLKALIEGAFINFLPEDKVAEIIRMFLSCGISLDQRLFDGGSTLHYACSRGFADAVDVLLKAGADSELLDYQQQRPLDVALAERQYKCAKLLLDNGAEPAVSDLVLLGLMDPDRHRYLGPSNNILWKLLEKDKSAHISDHILLLALENYRDDDNLLDILYQRYGRVAITPGLVLRITNKLHLDLLFARDPEYEISSTMASTIIDRKGIERVRCLLENLPHYQPGPDAVIAILEAWDLYKYDDYQMTLQLLWVRNPELDVTTDMLKIAPAGAFEVLVPKADRGVYAATDVLDTLVQDESSDRLKYIFNYDPSVILPFEIATRGLSRPGYGCKALLMEHILMHHPSPNIDEETFLQLLPAFSRGYLGEWSPSDAFTNASDDLTSWIRYNQHTKLRFGPSPFKIDEQYAELLGRVLSERGMRFELTPKTRDRIEYNFWVPQWKSHQDRKAKFFDLANTNEPGKSAEPGSSTYR